MLNLTRLLTVASMVAVFAVATALPASAELVCVKSGDTDPSTPGLQYGCIEYGDSGGGDSGGDGGTGGGPAQPTCTFFDVWNDYCSGTLACYINDPAALQDPDDELVRRDTPGLPEKPPEADHLVFTSCTAGPGAEEIRTYSWNTEFEAPSLEDQIRSAAGQLVLPTITPRFNPPVQSIVNLETWFWAEGATTDEIVGSDALGLRAVATPGDMAVSAVAGARSESETCPVVTSESDACAISFRRSGQYTVTMSITYQIRFELNGEVIEVPGGLEDLTTMTTSAQVAVPVVEIQSLVKGVS